MIRMLIITLLCVNVAHVAFASASSSAATAAAAAADGKATKETHADPNSQAKKAIDERNKEKLRAALKNGANALDAFFTALWGVRDDEGFELALICADNGLDLTHIGTMDDGEMIIAHFIDCYKNISDKDKKQKYSKQYEEIMGKFLEHPAVDLDRPDGVNETLLDIAVAYRNWTLFYQLLFLGAKPDTVHSETLAQRKDRKAIEKMLEQAAQKDFSFIPEEEIVACESLATRRRMMNKGNFKVKNMFTDRMHKQAGIKMVKYAAASFELPGRLHQALQQENRGQFSDEDELPSAKKAKVEAQKNEKTQHENQPPLSLAAAQQSTNSSSSNSSSSSSSSN